MKYLLAILIFATMLGGYVSASHAKILDLCTSIESAEDPACTSMHEGDKHHHENQSDSGDNGICLDCHHCCAFSHAVSTNVAFVMAHFPEVQIVSASQFNAQDSVSSLLRPPKHLV